MTSQTSGLVGQFKFNTLNRFLFPNKGTDIFIENKLVLIPFFKDEESVTIMDSTLTPSGYNQHEEFSKSSTLYAPYNKLTLMVTNLLLLNCKFSVFSCITMGFTSFNAMKFNTSLFQVKYNYYDSLSTPVNDNFFIGGVERRSRNNFSSLWGLNEAEMVEQNFAALRVGIQCEVLHKLFITPAIAYYYSAASAKHFFKYLGKPNTNGEEYLPVTVTDNYSYGITYTHPDFNYRYTALITYGLNIGYKSPIGPINFNISKPSMDQHWRAYVSIGYRF